MSKINLANAFQITINVAVKKVEMGAKKVADDL
jgi:hypothetical protein